MRHEYLNGAAFAMSAAPLAHNQITLRLATGLASGGPLARRRSPQKVAVSSAKISRPKGS
ncbi:MAG: hypothetical protein KGL45_13905 [Gammaproteobacteria bacterium]|nr:hypothetical protein [Gammaproteobacteria bacterium]MDE2263613.1 hypothetical protein [Gammaproteobacteria bacterium]